MLEQARESGLRVGFGQEIPYGHLDDQGNLTGFDIEVTREAARRLGIEKIIGVYMGWGGLTPGLLAGRFDIIPIGMAIRPERCEVVNFSDPIYLSTFGAMVRAGNPKNIHGYKDFVERDDIKMGGTVGAAELTIAREDFGIPQERVITVEVTLLDFLLAAILGLFVALARMSRRRWLRIPFTAYLEFIRNTPFLVQLYVAFWVLPVFGIILPVSSYLSEVYRAGIGSVDRGQFEAATVLGMSRSLAMRRIVLSQAVRTMIPAMGNYLIGMFKALTFVSIIGIEEILWSTRWQASTTFRFFEVYTGAALLYLVVSFPAARVVNALERCVKRPERVG